MRYSMMFHDVCRFKIWFYRNFCLRSGGSGRYTPTPAEVGMIRFSLYFFTFFGQFTKKKAILILSLLSKVRGLFLILLTVFLPWDFCCNHPAEELARRLFVVLDHIQIWAPGITRVATFFFPGHFCALASFFCFCLLSSDFVFFGRCGSLGRTSNFYSPEPSVRSSEFGSLYDSSSVLFLESPWLHDSIWLHPMGSSTSQGWLCSPCWAWKLRGCASVMWGNSSVQFTTASETHPPAPQLCFRGLTFSQPLDKREAWRPYLSWSSQVERCAMHTCQAFGRKQKAVMAAAFDAFGDLRWGMKDEVSFSGKRCSVAQWYPVCQFRLKVCTDSAKAASATTFASRHVPVAFTAPGNQGSLLQVLLRRKRFLWTHARWELKYWDCFKLFLETTNHWEVYSAARHGRSVQLVCFGD